MTEEDRRYQTSRKIDIDGSDTVAWGTVMTHHNSLHPPCLGAYVDIILLQFQHLVESMSVYAHYDQLNSRWVPSSPSTLLRPPYRNRQYDSLLWVGLEVGWLSSPFLAPRWWWTTCVISVSVDLLLEGERVRTLLWCGRMVSAREKERERRENDEGRV